MKGQTSFVQERSEPSPTTRTMKAFVMHGIGRVGIVEKPVPEDPGPNGTISKIDYHGHVDYVGIPRIDWGVGMGDKVIRTALCPGGQERMRRWLRLLETGRVDPTPLTTHRFRFDQIETAFQMMAKKEDGIIKPLILF